MGKILGSAANEDLMAWQITAKILCIETGKEFLQARISPAAFHYKGIEWVDHHILPGP